MHKTRVATTHVRRPSTRGSLLALSKSGLLDSLIHSQGSEVLSLLILHRNPMVFGSANEEERGHGH
jgi:hypothetical protein